MCAGADLVEEAGKTPFGELLRPRVLVTAMLVLAPAAAAMAYYNYSLTGSATLLPYVVNERRYASSPRFYLAGPIPEPAYNHEYIRRNWDWDRALYEEARRNPLSPAVFASDYAGALWVFRILDGGADRVDLRSKAARIRGAGDFGVAAYRNHAGKSLPAALSRADCGCIPRPAGRAAGSRGPAEQASAGGSRGARLSVSSHSPFTEMPVLPYRQQRTW